MKQNDKVPDELLNDPDAKVISLAGKQQKQQKNSPNNKSDDELNKLFSGTPYFVENGCLMRITGSGENVEHKKLANFVPIPIEELTKDDGLNIEKYFTVYGKTQLGFTLREVMISADKFISMNWIPAAWGFSANLIPGTSTKDYVRHAIMEVGGKHAKHKEVFAHTGWRKINDKWVFLYNNGAIGVDNANVELEGNLTRYQFPEKLQEYKEAAQASFNLLSIAPPDVMIPLLSIAYLSPLNEFLRQAGIEPAFILFLLGMTGCMKSTLSALILNHFGEFSNKNLPASFKDTPNSLEKKGFLLKDVLTIVDDFHPTNNRIEAKRMESTAQAITRGYGDRAGRNRMNSDTSLKMSYIPRGNAIITGEDLPNIGQSGTARHITVELKRGDISKELLTEAQSNSKMLNYAMRGYIEWLIQYADELPKRLKEQFMSMRQTAQNNTQHARMPETVAWLQIGFRSMLGYFKKIGILNPDEYEEWQKISWNVFMDLADRQSKRIEEDRPSIKFINTLKELLNNGSCYTIKIHNVEEGKKESGFIGIEDVNCYYFYPETVYQQVVRFINAQGENFPVSKNTLFKHLAAEGFIVPEIVGGRQYNVKKKLINGNRERFLWMKKEVLQNDE